MDPTSRSASKEHGKIPPHATRVYQGVVFDVYQWEQRMFDGSTAVFEKLRRVPSTDIILVDGDEILIAEQEQPDGPPFLSLFGGRVEPGEEPLASAKRELREESGHEADHWKLLEVSNAPWAKIDWENYLYLASGAHKVAEPQHDAGERIVVRRVSVGKFLELGRTSIRWKHPTQFYEWVVKPDAAARLRSAITTMKGAS